MWSRNINRNFSEEELEKFFGVIDNKKHLMCFKLQAYLGLRIPEAVKFNLNNVRSGFSKIINRSIHYLHKKVKVKEGYDMSDYIGELKLRIQDEKRDYIKIEKIF